MLVFLSSHFNLYMFRSPVFALFAFECLNLENFIIDSLDMNTYKNV